MCVFVDKVGGVAVGGGLGTAGSPLTRSTPKITHTYSYPHPPTLHRVKLKQSSNRSQGIGFSASRCAAAGRRPACGTGKSLR